MIKNRNLMVFLGIIILVGIVIFMARVLLGGSEDAWICENNGWVKHGNPSVPAPVTGCGPVSTPFPINFNTTGNLTGSTKDGWLLVYEEPGEPALEAALIFNYLSICKKGPDTIEVRCASLVNIGRNGDRVSVEGQKEGGVVKVTRLQIED